MASAGGGGAPGGLPGGAPNRRRAARSEAEVVARPAPSVARHRALRGCRGSATAPAQRLGVPHAFLAQPSRTRLALAEAIREPPSPRSPSRDLLNLAEGPRCAGSASMSAATKARCSVAEEAADVIPIERTYRVPGALTRAAEGRCPRSTAWSRRTRGSVSCTRAPPGCARSCWPRTRRPVRRRHCRRTSHYRRAPAKSPHRRQP